VFQNPGAQASFSIWARVIAPTDGDDSFWVKMDGGSAIKWNGIPLGSAWHWVQVKADGSSTASHFTLANGAHTLKIAYREDGTKLDAFIITSDGAYNPNTALTGAPAAPILNTNAEAGTLAGNLLSWNEVPGAQSYTLEDDEGFVIASGLTGHTWQQTGFACFQVLAVGTAGTSASSGVSCEFELSGFVQRKDPDRHFSVVSPMKIDGAGGLATNSGTAESLSAVPAHGRGRYDFRIVGPTPVQFFAEVGAPNLDNDSFWVRVDQGNWIKWNNIPNDGGCHPVSNSDAGGGPVTFNLATGSHSIEFAYREIGAVLYRLAPSDPNPALAPCED
jgi:hypothetical protein